MNKNKGVLVLLILSIGLVGESIRLQLPNILFGNGDFESMEVGIAMTPGNADLNFRLGRAYHNLLMGDSDRGEELFIKSLMNNPLLASSWLELSEVNLEKGDDENAFLALNRAKEVAPLSIARLWQGGILALRLEDNDLAFDNLKTVAIADPDQRYAVYEASLLVSEDPDYVLNQIVTDELLVSYLNYLITVKNPDASLAVWERLEQLADIEPNQLFMNYMNFLIDNKKSRQAYIIWSKIVGERDSNSLVWNGSFENDFLNGGFDWRVITENNQGSKMDMDTKKSVIGENSLKVEFDGKNNVEFYHLFQIVPVEPNKEYRLSAKISTDNITTKNGIRLEAYCYPNYQTMSNATEQLTGTNQWTDISLTLNVPEDCEDILVRLRRFGSKDFDKFISGTAWIDDVKLEELGNI